MSTTQESKNICKTYDRQVYGLHRGAKTDRKYGRCLICNNRLYSSDKYVTTKQGYCCENCLEKVAEE